MAEITHDKPVFEQDNSAFETTAHEFLDIRTKMIEELKQLKLADLIRLLRAQDDPISQLAESAGVYNEIAGVHFPGENSAGAFNFLLSMALRHVADEQLDIEAPRAKAWVLRKWSHVYGLEESLEIKQ